MSSFELELGKDAPFKEKWHIFSHIEFSLYTMVRHAHNVVNYAPLFIHRFRFLQPHFLLESEKFNITYPDPSQLMDISDKLRYYRYKAGLLQREVADHVGIERTTYSSYEEVGRDYYPIDVLARIADLFEVDIADLMDGYHAFLHRGQAIQVRALRKHMGLTQKAFATRFNVSVVQVKRWEQGKVRVARKKWHIMFDEEIKK